MTEVSVEEIKQDVLAFLNRVEAGETLVVSRAGKPLAEVKPPVTTTNGLRPFGLCAGEFVVPDDFDYFGSANERLIEADFCREKRRDFTIRKEILWESESASAIEVNQKEKELILAFRANDPAVRRCDGADRQFSACFGG